MAMTKAGGAAVITIASPTGKVLARLVVHAITLHETDLRYLRPMVLIADAGSDRLCGGTLQWQPIQTTDKGEFEMNQRTSGILALFGAIAAIGLAGCDQTDEAEEAARDTVEEAKQAAGEVVNATKQRVDELLGQTDKDKPQDAADKAEPGAQEDEDAPEPNPDP